MLLTVKSVHCAIALSCDVRKSEKRIENNNNNMVALGMRAIFTFLQYD